MKNFFVFFIAILVMASCEKKSPVEEPVDKWNGYAKYMKMGEVIHPLLAGANKQTNIGTVTYGIDDNANFYVTYNITGAVWKMSQTSMYCGDKKHMPLNKAGNPRINRFPHKKTHNPKVTTYTIRVPLTSLPPAEYPGFVVAAHCVVYNPQKCDGTTKNAWADGDFAFTDKDWGWYDIFYYNQPPNEYTILYGTAYTNDSLKLYRLDVTNGTTDLIYKEKVENSPGTYDGTAFDVDSSMFFFTNINTGELFANRLNDTLPSFSTGYINGVAASGTFDNGAYYYVNADLNTINKVTFSTAWAIAGETVLDTIPSAVRVNDIAMNPEGNILYMLGEVNGGSKELISWNMATETFYTMAISITGGAQIAYGSDGTLYVVAPIVEGGSHSTTFTVDTSTGILTPIEDDIIIIDDPFSDISRGPIM